MATKFDHVSSLYYQRILAENRPAGARALSTQQLADEYNVSFVTANKVINLLVAQGVLYRKPGSGTFIRRALCGRDSALSIGLGFELPFGPPDQIDMAYSVFEKTAAQAIRSAGHDTVHLLKSDMQKLDATCLDSLQQLDGLLLSINYASDPRIKKLLRSLTMPVVVTQHEAIRADAYHQVVPDVSSGLASLAQHMVEVEGVSGHYAMLYPAYSEALSWHADLLRGELAQLGVDVSKIVTLSSDDCFPGDLGVLVGQELGEELLDTGFTRGTVFAAGDFVAFGLIRYLSKKGIAVGDSIKVASFDDLEGEGLLPFKRPILTSVKFPRREIMKTAVSLLIRLIKNPEPGNHTNIIRVPTKLIKRESTGTRCRSEAEDDYG
jgi:DNA-binding LacI/PurR family transcriptional regulator